MRCWFTNCVLLLHLNIFKVTRPPLRSGTNGFDLSHLSLLEYSRTSYGTLSFLECSLVNDCLFIGLTSPFDFNPHPPPCPSIRGGPWRGHVCSVRVAVSCHSYRWARVVTQTFFIFARTFRQQIQIKFVWPNSKKANFGESVDFTYNIYVTFLFLTTLLRGRVVRCFFCKTFWSRTSNLSSVLQKRKRVTCANWQIWVGIRCCHKSGYSAKSPESFVH